MNFWSFFLHNAWYDDYAACLASPKPVDLKHVLWYVQNRWVFGNLTDQSKKYAHICQLDSLTRSWKYRLLVMSFKLFLLHNSNKGTFPNAQNRSQKVCWTVRTKVTATFVQVDFSFFLLLEWMHRVGWLWVCFFFISFF